MKKKYKYIYILQLYLFILLYILIYKISKYILQSSSKTSKNIKLNFINMKFFNFLNFSTCLLSYHYLTLILIIFQYVSVDIPINYYFIIILTPTCFQRLPSPNVYIYIHPLIFFLTLHQFSNKNKRKKKFLRNRKYKSSSWKNSSVLLKPNPIPNKGNNTLSSIMPHNDSSFHIKLIDPHF